ncbi:MAG: alanine racemase [Desulfitobacteriaceae bacterium]
MEIFRPVWAEVDLEALTRNFRKIQAYTSSEIMPIVKADAYGHGVIPVVDALWKCGARRFGVALLEEALEIKQVFPEVMVMIIGSTPKENAELIVKEDIITGVFLYEQALALSQAATSLAKTTVIHLKIETGMGRIGFSIAELPEILRIAELPNLYIEGIYTHLATADHANLTYAKEQLKRFQEINNHLKVAGLEIPLRHVANSGAILQLPESHFELVRPGISLYGFSPSSEVGGNARFEPVMSWKTMISHVKTIATGDTVSYGRTFQAAYPTKVATIPVGYADGLRRALSNRGEAIVRGERVTIIGRVCMDQTMLEVTKISDIKVGDVVTILGEDGSERIDATEMASWLGTINYEVICGISKRVPRKYV